MKFWDQYVQFYMDHYSFDVITKEEGLPDLRDKLFISVLLLTFPICLLVYIPSVTVSLETNQFIIGLCDTIAILALIFIFFYKNMSIRNKKLCFTVTFYILSIILSVYLGIKGPSITILICTSVLITLFQSNRAGVISIALNAFIFLLMLAVVPIKSINLTFFQEYTPVEWLGVGLNLIAFNALLVFSVASLVDHLNESFLKEKNLLELLKKESLHLIAAKQKAEESDRLKSAFLANMSHEIRTPMNGILGFAELLKTPDLTGEEQQNYIKIIEKSGARMLNIINNVVDFSKIEAGQMKAAISETNVNELMEFIYTSFKPEVEKKGVQLALKNPLTFSEANVKTDREKLIAILANLIKNAIKYTHEGYVEFGCQLQGQNLRFYVKDTGIGIAKDRQKAIFERFIQADIEDINAYQGAGLGLSISKAYVEMLNGKLWVESEKEKGSIFYFTIPRNIELLDAGEIKTGTTIGKTEVPIKNMKILIVEDDETSDLLISIMLERISGEILHAKSGSEAIELCRNNPDLDLVLMDIKMPLMNGYEATRQIRKFNKDLVIIAQTAYSIAGDREKAMESGCNGYLSKPIIKKELLSLLKQYSSN